MTPMSPRDHAPAPLPGGNASSRATVRVSGAPPVPGLRFRLCAGSADYPGMVEVINAAYRGDGVDEVVTLDQHAAEYDHPVDCDPLRDVLIAEVNGRMVAYSRTGSVERLAGELTYGHRGHVTPAYRRRGLGRAMLRWNEEHLRALAPGQPADRPLIFDSWAMQEEVGAHALLRSESYKPARYFFDMLRPALDSLPEAPLPDGLEIRTVRHEDVDRILDADNEAFRDHWGHREATEQDRAALMAAPDTDIGLWVVAWDGDDPAGVAINTIYAADNEAFGRQRFWVDSLAVRRPWRRRGLGRALLVESLRLLRGRGMTSAALGVDSENLSGALGIYERVGFVVEKTSTVYRKPLTAGATP
jgi:mycothiol synthase